MNITEIINIKESMLAARRELFEITDDITYLNCAAISPQLRSVTAAGLESVKTKIAPWHITWEDNFSNAKTLRELTAKIIGAEKESVAIIPSRIAPYLYNDERGIEKLFTVLQRFI